MGEIERRMVLQSTQGMSVRLDPDTHRVIKAWAKGEGISIAYAIRIITKYFFTAESRKQQEGEKTNPVVKEKLGELVTVVRKAKESRRGLPKS